MQTRTTKRCIAVTTISIILLYMGVYMILNHKSGYTGRHVLEITKNSWSGNTRDTIPVPLDRSSYELVSHMSEISGNTFPHDIVITKAEKKRHQLPVTPYPIVNITAFVPNFFTKLDPKNARRYLNNDTITVFVHHNKAGGTYMRRCLDETNKVMQDKRTYNLLSWGHIFPWYAQRKLRNGSPRNERYIVGEATFGICETYRGNKSCSYLTMLREPYDRILSLYDHCHNKPDDWICSPWDIDNITVNELAIYTGSFFFQQLLFNIDICNTENTTKAFKAYSQIDKVVNPEQTRCVHKIKAYLNYYLDMKQRNELLQYVLDNLENWFTVIGMQDEYSLSLKMLEKAYGLPIYKTCNGNVTMKHANRAPIRVEYMKSLKADPRVYEALYYDIRIFEEARRIFDEQKTKLLGSY